MSQEVTVTWRSLQFIRWYDGNLSYSGGVVVSEIEQQGHSITVGGSRATELELCASSIIDRGSKCDASGPSKRGCAHGTVPCCRTVCSTVALILYSSFLARKRRTDERSKHVQMENTDESVTFRTSSSGPSTSPSRKIVKDTNSTVARRVRNDTNTRVSVPSSDSDYRARHPLSRDSYY